jgi:hypothetical protein
MIHTLRFFFSSKCSLFHNTNVFGSCIIHILYTECAKIKKNNSGAKRLRSLTRMLDWQNTTVKDNSFEKPHPTCQKKRMVYLKQRYSETGD